MALFVMISLNGLGPGFNIAGGIILVPGKLVSDVFACIGIEGRFCCVIPYRDEQVNNNAREKYLVIVLVVDVL